MNSRTRAQLRRLLLDTLKLFDETDKCDVCVGLDAAYADAKHIAKYKDVRARMVAAAKALDDKNLPN